MPLEKALDALNLRRVKVDEKTGACEVSFRWTPRSLSPRRLPRLNGKAAAAASRASSRTTSARRTSGGMGAWCTVGSRLFHAAAAP